MLRAPDIAEIRTFCTAAESGSLGRAAIRLNLTQPALSKRIASLERHSGVTLFKRTSTGVTLTPAGLRLYEHARRLLEQADEVEGVLQSIGRRSGPLRLAASHSAAEAFAAQVLSNRGDSGVVVELITANSHVVRNLVADGAVDLGVAASRPGGTPNPNIREVHLADDEIVCHVPRGHLWARLGRVSLKELLRTPMVLRDPQSNARWTVDAVLHARGLELAPAVVEAATPGAAWREALARNAPTLLSRRVVPRDLFCEIAIDGGLTFPRRYELVMPGLGDPSAATRALIEEFTAATARWSCGGTAS